MPHPPRSFVTTRDLTDNHALRDLLSAVRHASLTSEELLATLGTYWTAAHKADAERQLRSALAAGLIAKGTDGKLTLQSPAVAETLDQLDTVRSSCGATMVRKAWGLPLYCWQCGGLM